MDRTVCIATQVQEMILPGDVLWSFQTPQLFQASAIRIIEWLTEFSGRREQTRGALVQMERDKVILAASDVAL